MIDQPSLAILIDCWHGSPPWPNLHHPAILSYIEKNQSIKTVVLASYNCREEQNSGNTIWYQNYNKFFMHSNLRKIRDLECIHRQHNQRDTRFPNEITNPLILNYVNIDKFQISMLWMWELEYYLELNPDIKNIYVFGAAWEECVKKRPLGYEALKELKNINIMTKQSCIKSFDGTYPSLKFPWSCVGDDIYRLIHVQK
jgi:hypothetical protein